MPTGFFDQPVSSVVPNPEPPETTLMRDLLARKTFDLQADPYGGNQMRPNTLTPAPAFQGSGGGPSSDFFYGPGQQGSGGGSNAPSPRQLPILSERGGRQPRMVSRPPGHFFDDMSAARPQKDSRAALIQLLARMRSGGGFFGGGREVRKYDGGQPSADLPGYDGFGPSMAELHQMSIANHGRPPTMAQLQSFMPQLSALGISGTANPGQGMTFSGNKGGSYASTGASHEGGGPGGQSQFLYNQLGIQPKGKASGQGINFDPRAYGKVRGLDYLLSRMTQMQRRARGGNSPQPGNPLPPGSPHIWGGNIGAGYL